VVHDIVLSLSSRFSLEPGSLWSRKSIPDSEVLFSPRSHPHARLTPVDRSFLLVFLDSHRQLKLLPSPLNWTSGRSLRIDEDPLSVGRSLSRMSGYPEG